MTHQSWIHLFAIIFVITGGIVLLIDLFAELGVPLAINLKWSFFWNALRYISAGCAFALATDVIF